jgi:acyl-CoA synthetase (AMP-forming)/AMP-acid ligase II
VISMMPSRTIVDVLVERAQCNPEDTAYSFLNEHGQETCDISYQKLYQSARAVAAVLSRYPRQSRIILILPTSVEFTVAFFGCLLAGMMAVPLRAPNNHRIDTWTALLDDCGPNCIIADRVVQSTLRLHVANTYWNSLDILAIEDIDLEADSVYYPPGLTEMALLQYTSGSTSLPKGVIISHENIMCNQRMIKKCFDHDRASTFVAWAPLYHDQGLIGNLLQPLYVGAKCVLMPPMAFVRSPLLWLRTIARFRAHTSGGPNFAYDMCIQRYKLDECRDLDLSSWKVAFNGAEPINPVTIRRFTEIFAPHGFELSSFFPCYGLAEATLFVSGGPSRTGPIFLQAPDPGDKDGRHREFVCSGKVHPQISVLMKSVSPEVSAGHDISEICISGPNVTCGYWNNRSVESFFIDPCSGALYFKTGDLGFLHNERLYVTGRIKEMMIIRGRNIYPYDIERTVAESHEHFRKGGCAVFSVRTYDAEEVVAVQEVVRTACNKLPYDSVSGVVRKNVMRHHDIMIRRLVFVAPGFIPKTSSGKIQRTLLAKWFSNNTVEQKNIIAAM